MTRKQLQAHQYAVKEMLSKVYEQSVPPDFGPRLYTAGRTCRQDIPHAAFYFYRFVVIGIDGYAELGMDYSCS